MHLRQAAVGLVLAAICFALLRGGVTRAENIPIPTTTPSTPIPTSLPTIIPTPSPTVPLPTPTAVPTLAPIFTPTPTSTPTPTRVTPPVHHRQKKHPGGKHPGKKHKQGQKTGGQQPQQAPGPPVISLPSVADLKAEGRLGNGAMPPAVRRWAYLIIPAARANGIPSAMIAAVMTAESGGNPTAWNSGSDARGLMQILHGPWNPGANIDAGAAMLAQLKQEFGTWRLALAGYNAGPGAVQEYGGVPPFAETESYVVIVQYYYDEYSNHPLSMSSIKAFHHSLSRYKKLHRRHVRYLKLRKGQHRSKDPGLSVLPDGCDSSQACQPRNLPSPIRDPFWPLGGTDPLPAIRP